jgi:excisionase family DNA binding protein
MTLHQVAEYLDCSYAAVLLLVMRDGLLVFRLGGVGDGWRVRRSDLEKWIAEKHVRATRKWAKARKQEPAAKKPVPRRGGPGNDMTPMNNLIA